ncbi:flagellar biosynthetic protein FlhB [Vallitalea longa]|uniref:Flagellar biosynthetic protein FlhB n=1 Tax=Vallitalea longa TaxID=2936439 RepID=A0A9W6DFQ9_9FIRM|nr:flagellar biosynthesis protein FlhB [Vallitalea longa]GKX28969.1 flagellar biosynthetic protein FlhB [Vallitalea longa]
MKSYFLEKKTIISYNLQFFAGNGDAGEKTEKPTERKREKAREEGQVAKSMEVTTALMLVTMFSAIKLFTPYVYDKMQEMFKYIYSTFKIGTDEFTINFISNITKYTLEVILEILFPFFAIAVAIGLVGNFLQVGWKPSAKTMKPKFNKLSPLQGFKRLFSLRSIMELLKSLLKISIIIIIVYVSIKDKIGLIILMYDLSLLDGLKLITDLALDIGIKVGAFFILVAVADYIYQRYSLEKQLKMTKQEVKQEYKETEGNPEIKSKIRQKMREASMKRMMQDLPNADVIITNPTHFAVAIQYDGEKSLAPVVIAKGVDILAAKIKSIAIDNDIEIVENKPLARTLYYTVDIGNEIPEELYQTVAEVLAFVYNLKKDKEG